MTAADLAAGFDDAFTQWRDRIAWGAITGLVIVAVTWAAWITDRTYHTPTADDVRELRISIHTLDKSVERLSAKIENATEPRIKP